MTRDFAPKLERLRESFKRHHTGMRFPRVPIGEPMTTNQDTHLSIELERVRSLLEVTENRLGEMRERYKDHPDVHLIESIVSQVGSALGYARTLTDRVTLSMQQAAKR